jgi:putative membrane protein
MSDPTKGPVMFDLEDDAPSVDPSSVPPVPDMQPVVPTGAAMQTIAVLAARKPSLLGRIFWGALVALVGAVVSVAAWDFAIGLITRNAVLGYGVAALGGIVVLTLLVVILRELAAFSRLNRLDGVQIQARAALADQDLISAKTVADRIERLYRNREDLNWGMTRFKDRRGDMFDADALLGLAEQEVLAPIDRAAEQQIQAAARQVATVTAIVPLAFADVFTALTANVRMIRQIAELYGGRSGVMGGWRLTRAVMTHLVATGAVAVGDDLIGSVAGGSLLSKLSRRFGEGIVNGALTARVGVAAMEVCRPLPFTQNRKPSVTGLVSKALSGLFQTG